MGKGPSKVKSTTTTAPPAYLQGPLMNAAGAAGQQFRGAQDGPDVLGQGRDVLSSTLNGDFINNNPYLDQTFNLAADATRGRLAGEFAANGRDQIAALPARSEELQHLSNSIYGGAYRDERNYMNNAITTASNLDPTNQYINQLTGLAAGAGGTTNATQPVFRTGLI